MIKRIYKYRLEFERLTRHQMPVGAEILSVQQDQKDMSIQMWALVNPDAETEERIFELYVAGNDINYDMGVSRSYIGTYQYQKGQFVGHIFEYTGV